MHLAGGGRIGQDGRTMYFPAVQTAYSGELQVPGPGVTDEEGDQTVASSLLFRSSLISRSVPYIISS